MILGGHLFGRISKFLVAVAHGPRCLGSGHSCIWNEHKCALNV